MIVWAVLLLLLAGALYLVFGRKEQTKERPVAQITITTATAQKGNIGVYLDAIGTVTPVYTASIFSQVTGVVFAVNYQEGQLVHKGDRLTDIDDRQYVATLLQAQGALERDENVLAQARMDLERYQAAWARNAVAKQILDDQEKLVRQNEGTVKNDQGTVQFDQLQVEYCHISAPFSGRVGLRLVDPGNLVAAGPVKTMAAKSIPGFAKFEDTWHERAPLGWDVTDSSAVAKACVVLLSDWLPMTTGEMVHVDGGYHAIGA